MNLKILSLTFLAVGLIWGEAKAQMPMSDFQSFVYCSNGKKRDKIDFTAYTEESFKTAKSAILISSEQPYAPTLNRVSYEIAPDHTIRFEQEYFSLIIQPNGDGVYQNKALDDTPPDFPTAETEGNAPAAKPAVTHPEEPPSFLYQPILLRCHTPFIQNGPIPPTGFSVGN